MGDIRPLSVGPCVIIESMEPDRLPPLAAATDADLERRAQAELLAAYDAWAPGLYRYLRTSSRNAALAQDLLHDAFLRLHATLLRGETVIHPRAWLFLAGRRLLLDAAQAYGARHGVSLDAAPDVHLAVVPAFDSDPAAHWREVWRIGTRLLSPRERECLQLRAEGLTHREIAGVLGLQVGTICTLVARAIRKIQRELHRTRSGAPRTDGSR